MRTLVPGPALAMAVHFEVRDEVQSFLRRFPGVA